MVNSRRKRGEMEAVVPTHYLQRKLFKRRSIQRGVAITIRIVYIDTGPRVSDKPKFSKLIHLITALFTSSNEGGRSLYGIVV